jgi:monothiol bacilliredoxin
METITTEADLAAAMAAPLAFIYKHSPICPSSAIAFDEVLAFRQQREVPVYLVDVLDQRPLSRAIAERTGVVHASPQAILVRRGVALWHSSHRSVRVESLIRALDRWATEGPPT